MENQNKANDICLVMLYTFGDGYTYSCNTVIPFMAESEEAALVIFEERYRHAKETNTSFDFAGEAYYPYDFEWEGTYYAPEFMELSKWSANCDPI